MKERWGKKVIEVYIKIADEKRGEIASEKLHDTEGGEMEWKENMPAQ